jgi:hypothetical protein
MLATYRGAPWTARHFLPAAAGALELSAYDLQGQTTGSKQPRVGIIGPGWYGKADLFRHPGSACRGRLDVRCR